MATNKTDLYVYAHWQDLILRGGLPMANKTGKTIPHLDHKKLGNYLYKSVNLY